MRRYLNVLEFARWNLILGKLFKIFVVFSFFVRNGVRVEVF